MPRTPFFIHSDRRELQKGTPMYRPIHSLLGLCLIIGLSTTASSQSPPDPPQSNRLKYHDPDSVASHPGGIELSLPRLYKLDRKASPLPISPDGSTSSDSEAALFEIRREHFIAVLKEHLEAGDSRAAVVASTRPLLVAAYNDDLDCVAMLGFPEWLVDEYDLQPGSRLLTVNTFPRSPDAEDLHHGPKKVNPYKNVYPIIADFVTEDKERLHERKSTISEEEWERCTRLAQEYRDLYPKSIRNGTPSQSMVPSKTPEQEANEKQSEPIEKNSDTSDNDAAVKAVEQGNADLKRNDIDSAIEHLGLAMRLNPTLDTAYCLRGIAYKRNGQIDNAITDYTKAIELKPDAEYYCLRGIAYGQRGDLDKAVSDYTKSIEIKPINAEPYCLRGMVYKQKGDLDKALADYSNAIQLKIDDVQTYYDRGCVYGLKGDRDHEIADYSTAIKLDRAYLKAYCSRATAYFKTGDYDKQIADYAELIRLKPDVAEYRLSRAYAYFNTGKTDAAIEDLNETIRLKRDCAEAYYYRARAYKNSNPLKVIEDCAEAIRLNPSFREAYECRGGAYVSEGDFDNAIDDFSKALSLHPDLLYTHYLRGDAYFRNGDYEKCIPDYTKAIRLKPVMEDAYYHRGLAHEENGNNDMAFEDYCNCIRLNPKNARVYVHRGVVYRRMGEEDKAQEDFKKARELGL